MGVCSYCLRYQSVECFGWGEARICGISGPNDPVRKRRQRARDEAKAKQLHKEADGLLQSASIESQELRRQADALIAELEKK